MADDFFITTSRTGIAVGFCFTGIAGFFNAADTGISFCANGPVIHCADLWPGIGAECAFRFSDGIAGLGYAAAERQYGHEENQRVVCLHS